MIRAIWILAVAIVGLAGISAGPDGAAAASQSGVASFYWQGQMTASGERFNPAAMTAAHKSPPFGTRVRVTHLASGRSVVVRINDRGPFNDDRLIDVSEQVAELLGFRRSGLARLRVSYLRPAPLDGD